MAESSRMKIADGLFLQKEVLPAESEDYKVHDQTNSYTVTPHLISLG